jgi:hypothetical protein
MVLLQQAHTFFFLWPEVRGCVEGVAIHGSDKGFDRGSPLCCSQEERVTNRSGGNHPRHCLGRRAQACGGPGGAAAGLATALCSCVEVSNLAPTIPAAWLFPQHRRH